MKSGKSLRVEDIGTELSAHEVRLFPSVSIKSDKEAELRAAASLLAAMHAVSEFGRALVKIAGGPAGRLSCFTEVPFQLDAGPGKSPTELRPDGIVQVARGKTRWFALVEVKVGHATLDAAQVESYHRLARQEGAGAVITISNQPALHDGRPPVALDGRRVRSIPVVHLSWERLLSEAQVLSRRAGVSDEDQKWILDEWIRYVDDSESRIIVPPDLGPHWGVVLKAARTVALAQSERELRDVARCWMGYLRKVSLRLKAKLGVDVQVRLSRKEKADSEQYVASLVADALSTGALSGVLKVPDAAGDIRIDVFLHSRSMRFTLELDAPTDGRQATRLKWLAKQLRRLEAPGDLQVIANWPIRNVVTTAKVARVAEDEECLLVDRQGVRIAKDVQPQSFQLQWTAALQVNRGRSSAPVLEGVSQGLERFYHRVVENIVPFVRRAPRLVSKEQERAEKVSAQSQTQGNAETSGIARSTTSAEEQDEPNSKVAAPSPPEQQADSNADV